MSAPVDVLEVLDPKESQIVSGRGWRFVRKDVRPVDVPVTPYAQGTVPTISKLRESWLFESTIAYASLDCDEPPPQAIVDATRLAEARAAVAELIEAVEDGIGYGIAFEDAAVRDRIAAALARVNGVQS